MDSPFTTIRVGEDGTPANVARIWASEVVEVDPTPKTRPVRWADLSRTERRDTMARVRERFAVELRDVSDAELVARLSRARMREELEGIR